MGVELSNWWTWHLTKHTETLKCLKGRPNGYYGHCDYTHKNNCPQIKISKSISNSSTIQANRRVW